MVKVVLNCHNMGINMSKKAIDILKILKNDDTIYEKCKYDLLFRSDPDLVKVVEALGQEANGKNTKLKILEINSSEWNICYDPERRSEYVSYLEEEEKEDLFLLGSIQPLNNVRHSIANLFTP